MRINVLKPFLDGRRRYEADEKNISVSDLNGVYFCACGWAEDISGEVPTGEIKPGTTKLDIRNIKRSQISEIK